MRKLFILAAFLFLFCAPHATHAQCDGSHPLYTARTAAQADVQLCLNVTHQCDDVIYVPPGAATWTTVTLTNPPTGCALHHGIRLYGATVVTVTGDGATASAVGDTNSTCNSNINACITLAATGGGGVALKISGCTPTSYCDVANMTFLVTVPSTNGQAEFITQLGTGGLRFHNFHIINTANCGTPFEVVNGPGLVDTFLDDDVSSTCNGNGIVVKGSGYASWSESSNFGSADAVFIENFRMNFSLGNGDGVCDIYNGGSLTMRHGYLNNFNGCGDHGYDSGFARGALRKELYNMTLVCGSSSLGNNRGGSYYDFNNTFSTGISACGTHVLQYYRQSNLAPAEITQFGAAGTSCPGCQWTPLSAVPDSSNSFANTLNAPDFIASHAYGANATVGPLTNNTATQNFLLMNGPRTSGAYPNFNGTPPGSSFTDASGAVWLNIGGFTAASPAPGVAAGFLSTNPDTPCSSGATCTNFVDNPGGSRFLRDQPGVIGGGQRPFPAYAFNETNPPANVFGSADSVAQVNRDFYNPAAGFNGTVGTGSGLLAARPATCTSGVAYWATDQGAQGTLYQCQGGAWVSYYQPYTSPHPERTPPCLNRMFSNFSGGTAGVAPTGATLNSGTHGFNFGTWSTQATDMAYVARSDMGLSLPTGTLCLDNTNWPGTESLVIERTGTGAVGVSSIHYGFNANANSPTSAAVCFMTDMTPGSHPNVDIFYLAGNGSTNDVVNITFSTGGGIDSFNIETKLTGGTSNAIQYTPNTIVTLILQYNRVQNSQLIVLQGCGGNGAILGQSSAGVMEGTNNPNQITIGSQGANQQLNPGFHIWYSVPQVALDGAFPITGAGTAPAVNFNPASLNFGSLAIGSTSASQTITITNTGTANLTFGPTGTSSPVGATFSPVGGGTCPISGTLTPGSSCTQNIQVTANSGSGVANGTFNFPSNAGALTVPLTVTVVSPSLSFSPTSLSFGSLPLYSMSAPMQATLNNTGAGSVTISSVTTSGVFAMAAPTVAPDCRTVGSLGAGASCNFAVTVTPAIASLVSGSVVFTDTAAGSPQSFPVSVTGLAVAPAPTPSFAMAANLSGCQVANPPAPTWCFTADKHIYFAPCGPITCGPFVPFGLTVSGTAQ